MNVGCPINRISVKWLNVVEMWTIPITDPTTTLDQAKYLATKSSIMEGMRFNTTIRTNLRANDSKVTRKKKKKKQLIHVFQIQ